MNSWHSTRFLPIWKTKSCSLNLYLYSFQMWKSDLKKWSTLKSTKSPFLASRDCTSYEEILKSFERAWGRDKGEIFFKIGKLTSKGRLNAIMLVRVIFFNVFSENLCTFHLLFLTTLAPNIWHDILISMVLFLMSEQ